MVEWTIEPYTDSILTCLLVEFACPFLSYHVDVVVFQNQLFSSNSFKNTIRVLNGLDPDQARPFVGPYLVPDCLQRLFSADDTVTSIQRV